MTISNVKVYPTEIMIATTLTLIGIAAMSHTMLADFAETKDSVVGYLITGLLGILLVIVWKWIDAMNENTKAIKESTGVLVRHDEKLISHDKEIKQMTNDIHDIRDRITSIPSEIHKTVHDAIEQKMGKK